MMRHISLPPRAIMFFSFAVVSIVNYAFGVTAGWLLLPGDFGLLAFAQTVLTIGGLLLNSGFTWSLAGALLRTEQGRRAALVRGASVANLSLAIVIGTLILLLFATGPLRAGLESWSVALLVVFSLLFVSLIATTRGALQGLERFAPLALVLISEVLGKAVGGILLVVLGFGAIGAIAGFSVGSALAASLGLLLMTRLLGAPPIGPLVRPSIKTSGSMFGAVLGLALLLNLDIVALKLFSTEGRAGVGYYQAAIVLANAPYYLASAMIPILFSRAAKAKNVADTDRAVGDALRFVLLFLVPLEIMFVIAPEMLLGFLFPAGYSAGAEVLQVLAVGNCALMFIAIISCAFQATQRAIVPARVLVGVTLLEMVVLYFGVPVWGSIGAATIFLLATTCALLLLGIMYLRTVGHLAGRVIGVWTLKYAAALVTGAVVLVVGLSPDQALFVVLGSGAAAYLCVAFALNLIKLPTLPQGRFRLGGATPVEES